MVKRYRIVSGIFSFTRFFRTREWFLTCIVLGLTICQVWLDLEIPLFMAAITDVITSHGTTAQVYDKSFGMVMCAVLSLLVGLGISITVGWISSTVAKRIREAEFDHVQRFSYAEIDRISSYSLITRSTNDVKQIQDFIGTTLEALMRAPIISLWAIFRISGGHLAWTAATFTAIAAMTALIVIVIHYTAPRFRRVQKLNDGVNGITSEMFTGQRVIRAYNAEDYEHGKFEEANFALTDNNIRANHIMAMNIPFNSFIRNTLTMSIYWIGAFVIAGEATEAGRLELFSSMIVFATYSTMALNGFRTLVQIFNVLPRAKVSMERIFEVLELEPSITDGEETEGDRSGSIRFDNVSFRYPSSTADVVTDASFEVRHGETVAVIGATGCGKTTLAILASRLYDATSGTVYVDGVDVKEYNVDALRGKIGYVSQKATIVAGSVRDNVNYGMGAENRTDEDIWEALEVACIDGFVESNGGLDSSLSEEGKNISGGQKQRISIARAVCKKPEIYIFDDCFSALDFKTDLEVRSRLRKVVGDASVLLVTQRIGTARDADRILVMDRGVIVDQGTDAELMQRCSIYREIADSQETGEVSA